MSQPVEVGPSRDGCILIRYGYPKTAPGPAALPSLDFSILGFEDSCLAGDTAVEFNVTAVEDMLETVDLCWEKSDPANPGHYIPMLPTESFVLGEDYMLTLQVHAKEVYDTSAVKAAGVHYSILRESDSVINEDVTSCNFEAGTDGRTYKIQAAMLLLACLAALGSGAWLILSRSRCQK